MKKILFAAVLVLFLAPWAFGDNVKLRWWVQYGNNDEKAPVDYALNLLKTQFPNVEITIDPSATDLQTLKIRATTGDLADILSINPGNVETLSKANAIIPLDDYVKATKFLDKMVPGEIGQTVYWTDGHIYALPSLGSQAIVYYYNKDLFAKNNVKVPTTYAELLVAVKAFNAKGVIPMALDGKEPWPAGALFDSLAFKSNTQGQLALATGKAKGSDYKEAFGRFAELVKAGLFQKGAGTADYETARALFEGGKAALFINGEWEIPDGVKALGDKIDFLPVYPTDVGANKLFITGGGEVGGIAVSATTPDKALATKVADALSSDLVQALWVKTSRFSLAQKIPATLQPETPLSPLNLKMKAAKADFKYPSAFAHNLPGEKFRQGWVEILSLLVAGEKADTIVAKVDALQKSAGVIK